MSGTNKGRIHVSNLNKGELYRLRSKSGEAIVRTIKDQKMDGWLVEIVKGEFTFDLLGKRYKKGDQFNVPVIWDGWYQPQG